MIDILKAVSKIIERFIAGMIPLQQDVLAGDTTIFVQSTRRFCEGDEIVIQARHTNDAEVHEIEEIVDRNTILLREPLVANWSASTANIQKLIGLQAGNREFLKAIYIGDPATIPQFPAITVHGTTNKSEYFTLESTSETYDIDISIYIDGSAFYENQYELMLRFAHEIKRALFRTHYPLVEPYRTTTLSEDVEPSDEIIRVTDENFFNCFAGWIFLESVDHTRPNRHRENLGNGIIQLVRPVGIDFSAGDTVIQPLRHIYNMTPPQIRYGTVNKNTILNAAVISIQYQEEVRRYNPFIDPLSF